MSGRIVPIGICVALLVGLLAFGYDPIMSRVDPEPEELRLCEHATIIKLKIPDAYRRDDWRKTATAAGPEVVLVFHYAGLDGVIQEGEVDCLYEPESSGLSHVQMTGMTLDGVPVSVLELGMINATWEPNLYFRKRSVWDLLPVAWRRMLEG